VRRSIGVKVAIVLSGFGLLILGLTSYYALTSSQAILLDLAKRDLLTSSQTLGRTLQLRLESIADDANIVASQSQAVEVLREGNSNFKEGSELVRLFGALIKAHPEYLKVRLISVEQFGLEQMVVDSADGTQQVAGLRENGHLPYVYETLGLPAGGIYFSDISDRGETNSAAAPLSMQVASPVYDHSPKALGVIVVDVDLRALLLQLETELPEHLKVILANEQGLLLLYSGHSIGSGQPDNPHLLLQNLFPETRILFEHKTETLKTTLLAEHNSSTSLAAFSRLTLGPSSIAPQLVLGASIDEALILQQSHVLGVRIAQLVSALSVLILLVALFLSRRLTMPLKQITQAMSRFTEDRARTDLPIMRQDELGDLARNLNAMQEVIISQISELESNHTEMMRLAYHDQLTALPNRRLFFDRLGHAIDNAQRLHKKVGLLFVDLDLFKQVNDTHGHASGDEVLICVAKLLRSVTRAGDTVARLGGDEFIILFDQVDGAEHMLGIAKKILTALKTPLLIGRLELNIQASLGISLFPDHGATAESLLQNADRAMYRSKQAGRNAVTVAAAES
jgi:diguanylate cyclase (GGDEF)-like protein